MPPDLDPFEFSLTLAIFLAAAAVVAGMSYLERRPRTSLNPRLLPTTPVLLVAGLVGLLAFVHLLNLWGIHTGRQ
jgi:hypothetical protein